MKMDDLGVPPMCGKTSKQKHLCYLLRHHIAACAERRSTNIEGNGLQYMVKVHLGNMQLGW